MQDACYADEKHYVVSRRVSHDQYRHLVIWFGQDRLGSTHCYAEPEVRLEEIPHAYRERAKHRAKGQAGK